MAGPEDVVRFAQANGVPVQLHADLGSVRTVVEASQRLERDLGEVGLTVLITVRGDPVLVLVPGDRRVDGGKVARFLGARASEVTLATREEAAELTGYETGTIPPFGHTTPTEVLLDETVLEHATLLFPAGAPDALIEVNTTALADLDGTRVGDWSVPREDDDA